MTIQTMNEGAKFIASSSDILLENQITLTIGTDFTEYKAILEAERPEQPLGAPFDPDLVNLNSGNAFWAIARDSDNVMMNTQAAKLINLGEKSLAEYLHKGFKEYPPTLPDVDFERSRFRATPGSNRIFGRVIYHGEFWLGGDAYKYRGTGLSTVLSRMAMYEALKRWNPDYIFGFLAQTVSLKGFGERMGYFHNEPGALRWVRKGSDKVLEGFLCYLSNEDARFLFEMPVRDMVAEPAPKTGRRAA